MIRQTGAQFLFVPGPDPWRGFDFMTMAANLVIQAARTVIPVERRERLTIGTPSGGTIAQVRGTAWPERRAVDLLHVGDDGGSERGQAQRSHRRGRRTRA